MTCWCESNKCGWEETNNKLDKIDYKYIILVWWVILSIALEIISLLIDWIFNHWLWWIFFWIIITLIWHNIIKKGIINLFNLNFKSINTLMTIAIVGAFYLWEYPEAAIIMTLFCLGEYLEDYWISKSKDAVKQLLDNAPKTVFIKWKWEIKIEELRVGDIIVIRPWSKIPVDWKLILGEGYIDESMITWEPIDKFKNNWDLIYWWSISKNWYFEIEVLKLFQESTLSKIIELTYNSKNEKANFHQFIERFSSYYTPSIVIIAILLVIIPVYILGLPFEVWLENAITLLVIACPCALVISTPISIYSAIWNASTNGILIKWGKSLEALANIKSIAFDKTKTLTYGQLEVTDIISYSNISEKELIACASWFELNSEHPVAFGIIKYAKEYGVNFHNVRSISIIPGNWMRWECINCSNTEHYIWNISYLKNMVIQKEIEEKVSQLQAEGKSIVVVSDNNWVKWIIWLNDKIKEESTDLIRNLIKSGINCVMLTWDSQSAWDYIWRKLGLEEVYWGLLPEAKYNKIKELLNKHKVVAMVGDWINDWPALALSSASISMWWLWTDLAIQTSDIIIMNDNLWLITWLIKLWKKTFNTIKFNTYFAIITKLIIMILAIFNISNILLAILSDLGVTIVVILISLSLRNYK